MSRFGFLILIIPAFALPVWAEDAAVPAAPAPMDVPISAPVVPSYPSETVGNKGTQTLNPDVSVLVDGTAGFWQRKPLSLAGDDPDFGGAAGTRGGGATLQEAELGFSSNIDPYLRGDAYLTIPNMNGLEV